MSFLESISIWSISGRNRFSKSPDATLLVNNSQHCWISTCCICLHMLLHVVECCWELLRKVSNRSNLNQQLQAFLLLRDHRKVAQQCWDHFRSFFNIAGATHVHYTWSPWRQQCNNFAWKTNTRDRPTLLGVVTSAFAHHCQHGRNSSQICWPNHAGSCCVRLHVAWRWIVLFATKLWV